MFLDPEIKLGVIRAKKKSRVTKEESQFYLETATAAESAASQWHNHTSLRNPFLAFGQVGL